ncbi:hypothetical protein Trydic_g4688 [Trypoxylus dichotomus]
MAEIVLKVYLAVDNKIEEVPCVATASAEDICILLCRKLGIGTVARHLFALRIHGKQVFLMQSASFTEKVKEYDLRIRFKVASTKKLKKIDIKAYDYYFHQARNDVLENKIPDLVYEKYRKEVVGLGITDMYRVMLEKEILQETVENDYKKYIPKEVLKRHAFFVKKPIHEYLSRMKKVGHDAWFVKAEYLRQLELMVPEYLAEDYKAVTEEDGVISSLIVRVSPFATEPGIKYCLETKKDKWHCICALEDLGFISLRKDGTNMLSFVSLVDGYYRLSVKWTFNICKDVITPSLLKLYTMKCHGPVGGEFSYAKLEEKRGNTPGCFILRESDSKYNIYYIDVCVKDRQQLMTAYSKEDGVIFLGECLPPSENEKSPLLLCQRDNLTGEALTDSSTIENLHSHPRLINSKDLQIYKVAVSNLSSTPLLNLSSTLPENLSSISNHFDNESVTTLVSYTFPPEESGNLTDVSECKVSHMGLDFLGPIGKTQSGARCQAWASPTPLHRVDPKYTDEKFSDFSKEKAKNYCRNPSRDPTGPWCYTMTPDNIYETCGVPLCIYTECRVTGPGMEYGGGVKKTTTGKKCLRWNKKRPKVRIDDEVVSREEFHKSLFPDESASYGKKNCRNPDSDPGGPWCFVEGSNKKEVEKEYCDVAFCQLEVCTVLTTNNTVYSHYSAFSESLTNFTFGIKLWHPDDYLAANARLVLSLFPLPLTANQIDTLGIGLEISIDNAKAGLTAGSTDKVEYETTFENLKSYAFTYYTLTWWHNVITLFKEGHKAPIFMADYKGKGTLMGYKMNKFRYYAAQGTNVVWSFPYCDDSDHCDVHTTTGVEFQRYFALPETSIGYDLNFHVRAAHSAYIKLAVSPVIEYPSIKVMIHRIDNYTRIEYQEHQKSSVSILHDTLSENLLNYWMWHEFTLSIFMGELQLYIRRDTGTYAILMISHNVFKKMRWFSPGSENCVAHWTFSCLPPANAIPSPAYPPECALNKKEPDYNGTQDLTSFGLPCLPWAGNGLLPNKEVDELFETRTDKYGAWNYCRDPSNKLQGTFCYTLSQSSERIDNPVKKEYCHIRQCKSAECKVAGTGNDYIGKETTTRSNRTCQRWISPFKLKMLDQLTLNTSARHSQARSLDSIALPDGLYSEARLVKHLLELHELLEIMKCEDKWKCLQKIYGFGKHLAVRGVANNSIHIDYGINERNAVTVWEHNDTLVNNTESIVINSTQIEITTHREDNITITQINSQNNSEINYVHATNLSDPSQYLNASLKAPHQEEVAILAHSRNDQKFMEIGEEEESKTSKYEYQYIHKIDPKYLNETLYADMDLKKIKNYCRNPSRDLAGSWCYTEDPAVPIDLCNVRDCDKPEECTIFLAGDGKGRKLYVLPQWKEEGLHGGLRFSVKQWNPDLVTGLAFDLLPLTGTVSIRLEIGANENERIILYYDSGIIKEKSMPHILSSGKWDSFWLQMGMGQIVLGYEGVPTPFFEWTHPNASDAIDPIYLMMSTITGYPLGISLKCDECHTEITNTKLWSKIFPIGLWKEEQPYHRNLMLHIRGNGDVLIPLYLMPTSEEYYSIEITDRGSMCYFYKHAFGVGRPVNVSYTHNFSIKDTNWTTIEISFTEYHFNITSNGQLLMTYTSEKPMLFYWFSVGTENGWITWAANCDPLDIDGDPLDGGWSKWSSWVCTVSCGGGTGYRTRTCSNPRPNIFGRLCEGSPTSTGVCNEFECGDVDPETMEVVRVHLRTNYTSLTTREGKSVIIENIPTLLGRLSKESPNAYYEWTLNGIFVDPKPGRIQFVDDNIVIKKSKPSDSGVYVCMFFRINKQRLVFHVVSLAVIPKKNQINTRATREATLSSNAVVLGYIYTGLKQKWLLNGATYIDYGTTTLAAVSNEYLSPLNESHSGEWKCVIQQSDLGFSWKNFAQSGTYLFPDIKAMSHTVMKLV